jgi:hypothetical protein
MIPPVRYSSDGADEVARMTLLLASGVMEACGGNAVEQAESLGGDLAERVAVSWGKRAHVAAGALKADSQVGRGVVSGEGGRAEGEPARQASGLDLATSPHGARRHLG